MSTRAIVGIRALGVGTLSGLIAGALVGGIGGRVVMRISGFFTSSPPGGLTTSNGNVLGEVTLPGTIALIIFGGILPGLAGGILYAAMRPILAPAGRWRGALIGVALLALLGSVIIDPLNFDFTLFGNTALNVLLFAGLFMLFGIVVEPIYDLIERNSRGAASMGEVQVLSLIVWLAALGGLLFIAGILIPTVSTLFRDASLEPQNTYAAALVLLVLIAASIGGLTERRREESVAVALLVVLGAYRTLEGIARIVT